MKNGRRRWSFVNPGPKWRAGFCRRCPPSSQTSLYPLMTASSTSPTGSGGTWCSMTLLTLPTLALPPESGWEGLYELVAQSRYRSIHHPSPPHLLTIHHLSFSPLPPSSPHLSPVHLHSKFRVTVLIPEVSRGAAHAIHCSDLIMKKPQFKHAELAKRVNSDIHMTGM